MAKFYGRIGYVKTLESSPGIWEETEDLTPHYYYGDILTNNRRCERNDKINENLVINNRISVLADPFAFENINAMKWIEFMGQKWKISSVDVAYPRIIISLGDVYNA